MDAASINPFLESLVKVLEGFGIKNSKIGQLEKKERMQVTFDVTAVIGLVGDIKGNVAYSLSQATAMKIVSAMMPGFKVTEFDAMARSAVGELANMITGMASVSLSTTGVNIDISPPSIIIGEDVYFIISPLQSLAVIMDTQAGRIEVNIEIT
ncbi:MAG: chemotaxis protein CheX [Bacillota bacterium]